MAIAKGTAASFQWNGQVPYSIKSVEFDFSYEQVDSTALANTAPGQFPTIGNLSWTVTYLRDVADTAGQNAVITDMMAGTARQVKIYETAAKYYESTCQITSYKTSADPKGVVTVTVSGSTSNGTIATYA